MLTELVVLMIVLFLVFACLNLPLSFTIGLATVVPLLITGDYALGPIGNWFIGGINSYSMLACPFFILAGELMTGGGISEGIVTFCRSLVGRVKGNLPVIAVLGCTFFGAISGSGPATIGAIGGIMIPYLVKAGYPLGWSAALMACAGCIGSFIPPSLAMVNYAVVAGTSVENMLLSGVGPGLLTAVALILYSVWYSIKHAIPVAGEKFSLMRVFKSLKEGIWPLLMPVIILGGIYGGFFTPTEASAISCLYAFLVGMFVTKKLRNKELLKKIFLSSANMTGMIMLTTGLSTAFGKLLTVAQLPNAMVNFVAQTNMSQFTFLVCIMILFLFTGTFMNPLATVLIMTPILLPIAKSLSISPIHFGCAMVVNTTFGMITPPLGAHLFYACGMTGIKFSEILKHVWVEIILAVIVIALVTFFPVFSTFLIN